MNMKYLMSTSKAHHLRAKSSISDQTDEPNSYSYSK